jgi:hypothetical protein
MENLLDGNDADIGIADEENEEENGAENGNESAAPESSSLRRILFDLQEQGGQPIARPLVRTGRSSSDGTPCSSVSDATELLMVNMVARMQREDLEREERRQEREERWQLVTVVDNKISGTVFSNCCLYCSFLVVLSLSLSRSLSLSLALSLSLDRSIDRSFSLSLCLSQSLNLSRSISLSISLSLSKTTKIRKTREVE